MVHVLLQVVVLDKLPVLFVQESPPLAHLEDDQVDQVDDEHDQGHQEEALGLHGRDGAAADQGQGHDGAEDVLGGKESTNI